MKEDVYFLLEDNHTEYFVPRPFDKNLDYITVFSRKEYEMRKNKIEEAKRNQLYYYNPESGRDNLKIKVPKLTFKVKSSNKILLKDFEISSLKLIDFDWIFLKGVFLDICCPSAKSYHDKKSVFKFG